MKILPWTTYICNVETFTFTKKKKKNSKPHLNSIVKTSPKNGSVIIIYSLPYYLIPISFSITIKSEMRMVIIMIFVYDY